MLIRTLIACSFLVAPVIAQAQALQPLPETKTDPRIQRFLNKPHFFAQKKAVPVSARVQKAQPAKVCSIPLIDVTPPEVPYMPSIKPPADTHPMSIAPPAPPCDTKPRDDKRVEAP